MAEEEEEKIMKVIYNDGHVAECAPEEERDGMRARLTVYLPKNKLTPWLTYLAAFTDGYICHGLYGVKKQ